MLPLHFLPNDSIVNRAVCGYTTKSCLANRWPDIASVIQPGDYVIIQLGHNDSKSNKPGYCPVFGTYKENLERLVRETREKQGIPVLATSVARRAISRLAVADVTMSSGCSFGRSWGTWNEYREVVFCGMFVGNSSIPVNEINGYRAGDILP
ncbi:MAG: hypothetical protein KA152_13845 [Verrucomicrobiales bacterium]|nr:hypothetical protein [Verrucomicrobiales bacterium]MBP9222297.1 hypothetical protein [Verrucomicrobiales bacterium]